MSKGKTKLVTKIKLFFKNPKRITLVVFVFIFAFIGIYLLTSSRATTPYVSINADQGTLNCASVVNNSNANDGKIVQFTGTCSTIGNQPSPPTIFDSTDGSTPYLTSQIPFNPVPDVNSASLIGTLSGQVLGVNTGPDWIIPLYNTNNSDPSYSPSLTHASDWGCEVSSTNVIHIPNYATRETPGPNPSYWDGWIGTVNTDTNMVSGIWKADKSSGTWNGACGGAFPLHGNGFRAGEAHPTYGVGTGSGSQIGAGLILYSELMSGSINHALYMTSKITCKNSYRAPASKTDGADTTSTCWPMGARVQLNPSINCDTLGGSAVEAMVCHALEKYGGYVMDSGGGGNLTGIATIGDDMTDPSRSPWQTPGAPVRGSANCTPISATCGVLAHFGVVSGTSTFPHIPTSQLKVLNSWNGT